MTLEISDFGIKIRDPNSRFWVVRASGGEFVPNFVQGGIAAIGHLDNFPQPPSSPSKILNAELIKFLKSNKSPENISSRSTRVGNSRGQIENFVHQIKAGDTIVSVDAQTVAVGVAMGEAFFDKTPVIVQHLAGPPTELNYTTRRAVKWEHQFRRSELPLVVRNTLQAHQTVFSLDRHWTYIYHLIYPIFADEQNLYYSNFIHQKRDVSANAMAKLMAFFSDIEPILFGNSQEQAAAFENQNLQKLLQLFELENSKRYTTFKTEVFSEGPVWWKMPLKYIQDYRRVVILLVVISALFGGEMGPLKLPGIITPEMREKMLDFILQRIQEHDLERAKKELLLDIPRKFSNPRITDAIITSDNSIL